jgi:CheY-like chemotaxis protein
MIHSVIDRAPALNPRSQRLEIWSAPNAPRNDSFRPCILIGDDDQTIRAILGQALRKRGFRTLLATDGEKALELYGLHQKAINLVLLDVNMPGLDGPESLKVLRDFDPDVACCFMSGGLGAYGMEDLEALTPLPFFAKPLHALDTVEVLWQVAQLENGWKNRKHRLPSLTAQGESYDNTAGSVG